jgi:hypothetical protein
MSFEWEIEYFDRMPKPTIEPVIVKNKFELAREASETFNSLQTLFYPGGSMAQPPLNKVYYRMYNHHLCPISARARYFFAAKKINYQCVHMNQDNIAPWHMELNRGYLPILETPLHDIIIRGE